MELQSKLEILADAAKYDASCASSGAARKDSRKSGGIGSTGGVGVCHSYTPDGRCVSLLKVLLTNSCIYDCHYCINRRSSNVRRARFTPDEVVKITLDFYKRNYIEGLFLSSGIIQSADHTMELVIEVARKLREDHRFRGYIHLKTIPEASPELIERAGRFADRISINIELPSESSIAKLAPEKNLARTQLAMAHIRNKIDERFAEKTKPDAPKPPPFATGQSTQMIIGADDSTDSVILRRADTLYTGYKLRRVYYSGFSRGGMFSPTVARKPMPQFCPAFLPLVLIASAAPSISLTTVCTAAVPVPSTAACVLSVPSACPVAAAICAALNCPPISALSSAAISSASAAMFASPVSIRLILSLAASLSIRSGFSPS